MTTNRIYIGSLLALIFVMGCQSGSSGGTCYLCLNDDPYFTSCEASRNSSGEKVCIEGEEVKMCMDRSTCCELQDLVTGPIHCQEPCSDNSPCADGLACTSSGLCKTPPSWAERRCTAACNTIASCANEELMGCVEGCIADGADDSLGLQAGLECVTEFLANGRCDADGFRGCANVDEPAPTREAGESCDGSSQCINGSCINYRDTLFCADPCDGGVCETPLTCRGGYCVPQ